MKAAPNSPAATSSPGPSEFLEKEKSKKVERRFVKNGPELRDRFPLPEAGDLKDVIRTRERGEMKVPLGEKNAVHTEKWDSRKPGHYDDPKGGIEHVG